MFYIMIDKIIIIFTNKNSFILLMKQRVYCNINKSKIV